MQARELNTQEAPTKWFAAMDARMRNLANKSRYPQTTQIQIDRMKMVMNMVYAAKGVYEAYGKKGAQRFHQKDYPTRCHLPVDGLTKRLYN